MLAGIGRRRLLGFIQLERREVADEIQLAVARLSKDKTGALIVVEREIGLRTFTESGINLDAVVSVDLLLSIFQKGGALHDGAVIIHRDRVVAASCFLPLTTNPELTARLGTRHRAAIGITEEADCLALVVSEDTGRISLASSGKIEADVSPERIIEVLTSRPGEHEVRKPYVLPPGDQGAAPPPDAPDAQQPEPRVAETRVKHG